jgi:hypothetical protein
MLLAKSAVIGAACSSTVRRNTLDREGHIETASRNTCADLAATIGLIEISEPEPAAVLAIARLDRQTELTADHRGHILELHGFVRDRVRLVALLGRAPRECSRTLSGRPKATHVNKAIGANSSESVAASEVTIDPFVSTWSYSGGLPPIRRQAPEPRSEC